MMLRLSKVLLAGVPMAFVVLVAGSTPTRADDAKTAKATKWETTRTTEPEDIDEIKALQDRVKKVVDKCSPSTVAILIGFGAGSGVIVSEDGLVLTAAHVITGEEPGKGITYEAGKECSIVLPDGKKVKAKTLGVNTETDAGMVQITDKGPNDGKWPFLPVLKSGSLKKGQWVVSLGHPGGPKSGRPPVARLGRVEDNTKDLVRTNCTLVGGDSGGPLFDLDGNVIGIHSRIGITLAHNIHVPTDLFKNQWEKLVAGEVFGKVKAQGPRIGVVFSDDENDDAWIEEVADDTPASRAGLKAGDTVVKINGERIKSVKQFRDLIRTRKGGEMITLTVRRGTKILPLTVTLEK